MALSFWMGLTYTCDASDAAMWEMPYAQATRRVGSSILACLHCNLLAGIKEERRK